ncbi:acyltransferase [Vibrio parahaemolyticus]|nr:acyltransferase [Vibrio parahaemolyticus]HAS6570553.1 acyltransferase family protein [Vibrio parahaemolyticus]
MGKNLMMDKNYGPTNFITGLRGIAILFVLLTHALGDGSSELGSYLKTLVLNGRFGVQMFFVISGFTIFYQFYSAGYKFKKFMLVRLLRLGLPYYPIIILLWTLYHYGILQPIYWANHTGADVDLVNVFMHFTYLGMLSEKYINTIIGVEWTLYVEVFYYLFIGSIISFFLMSSQKKWFVMILTFVFFISLLSPLILKLLGVAHLTIEWSPIKYGYLFILGGLGYYVREKYSSSTQLSNASCIFLFLCIFLMPFINSNLIKEVSFGFSTFLVICFSINGGLIKFMLENKVIIFLGNISFSLYLLHMPVISFFKSVFDSTMMIFSLSVIVSLLLSKIYYNLVERTLYTKLKRKII